MDGIVAVQENRETIDTMKQWKLDALRKVENNYNREVIIDKGIDIVKNVVKVGGFVGTVALTLFPLDGPVGEVALALGTPALLDAIESSRDLLKGALVDKDTEKMSAAFIDLAGNCQQIKLHDKNMVANVAKKQHAKQEMASSIETVEYENSKSL